MLKKLEEIEAYKPLVKDNVKIDGITMNTVIPGGKVQIAKKMWINSFNYDFQTIAGNLVDSFCGTASRNRINNMLVRIRDENAFVFLNFPLTFEVSIATSKDISAGTAIFKNQVQDLSKAIFSDSISYFDYIESDKIIYLFRNGFSFGLYLNLIQKDSIDVIGKEIARAYREIEYYNVYESLKNNKLFQKIVNYGWFPFIALIRYDKYGLVLEYYKNRKTNKQALMAIKDFYDRVLLEQMIARWFLNPILKTKEELILSGVNQYLTHTKSGYIASIKILITEIEGLLREKYKVSGRNNSMKNMLGELEKAALTKYQFEDSLVLPQIFIQYLRFSIYGKFSDADIPNNRNSIAHGVASPEQYNWIRALQIILALDHLLCFL